MPDDEHSFRKFISDIGLLIFIKIICLVSLILSKKWNKIIGKIIAEEQDNRKKLSQKMNENPLNK